MNGPLNKLHDFYQPPPPAWTPQTAGWYVVFSVIGLLILWLVGTNHPADGLPIATAAQHYESLRQFRRSSTPRYSSEPPLQHGRVTKLLH